MGGVLIVIDKSSPIPLYCQLKAGLEQEIESGRRAPGARMPSELELAANFHVSRTTARQALQKLGEDGLVVRIQGKGTFVRRMTNAEENGVPSPLGNNDNASALNDRDLIGQPRLRPRQAIRLVQYRDGEDIVFDRSYQNLLSGIEREARERGYDLILSSCMECESELHSLLEHRGESGYVLYGEFTNGFSAELAKRGIPAVTVDMPAAGSETFDRVCVNHRSAAKLAVEHLLALDHRAITYVGGARMCNDGEVAEWPISRQRCEGFLAALRAAGIKHQEDYETVEFTTQRHAYRTARRLFDQIHRPTAVITFSPSVALGVGVAAAEKGLDVPKDLSLICFSDAEQVCFRGDRTFTTIWSDSYEMGRQAVSLLAARVGQPARAPQTVAVPSDLWLGDTCARPARVN